MSISVKNFKVVFDGTTGINEQQATVDSGRNNVLKVSGLSDGDILKFEVSVDGGNTFVVDESLNCEKDGVITLETAAAIIKVKADDVADTSNLLVQLGF